MSKKILKKTTAKENGKCVKCGNRDATGQDKMCDHCRFTLALENMIETRT